MALLPIFVVYIVTRWPDWAVFIAWRYRVRDFADSVAALALRRHFGIRLSLFDISMLISAVWSLAAVFFEAAQRSLAAL